MKTLCLAVTGFLLFSTGAFAKNDARLAMGCAPWDGRALELALETSDGAFQINIWSKGYDELLRGKLTLRIEGDAFAAESHGRALKLSSTDHQRDLPIAVTVHFDTLELSHHGRAMGWVEIDNKQYPFDGEISGMALCG